MFTPRHSFNLVRVCAFAIPMYVESSTSAFGNDEMKFAAQRLVLGSITALLIGNVWARDLGDRYADSPLKAWFDQLASGKGRCCSIADGEAVADADWDSKDGHYRVRLSGEWIDVPDDAVITEPNRAGRTMVWPLDQADGLGIRCFMPGSMS
jgi:hypothetical protein